MKTIMNQCFGKVHDAFFGVVMFVFALSFLLVACNSDEKEMPEDSEENPQESATVQRRMKNEHVIALAVCRVYDGSGISAKSFSQKHGKNC